MTRVGLTGGLASGKSFVGAEFKRLGCAVVRADELGHQALAPDGAAYPAVLREFGAGIVLADGQIDRKRLAAEVFGNPQRLAVLNSLVHPAVFGMQAEFFRQLEQRDPDAIGIVEAAILIETGNYRNFDKLILVVCTEEQQIARAVQRDGYTIEEATARLAAQMPLADKKPYADYLIDTSGSEQSSRDQVRAVYEQLRLRP